LQCRAAISTARIVVFIVQRFGVTGMVIVAHGAELNPLTGFEMAAIREALYIADAPRYTTTGR
jgi:hypothetical protein